MTVRVCGWCGADIGHMQPRAMYCSQQHKKNAASKRHRERNRGYYAKYTNSPTRVAYRDRNADRLRAYARAKQAQRRVEHPTAAARWWADNPERHRLYQAKRRSRANEGPGVSLRDWQRLVRRYDGCCAYCGERPRRLHMDHVVPLKRGGRHSIGNVLPACQSCNSSKNAQLLYRWRVVTLLTAEASGLAATA